LIQNGVKKIALLFMKLIPILILCQLPLPLLCQLRVGRPWTIECGASTSNYFAESASLNLRYISPRFKWSNDDETDEEEKHSEKLKKTRFMIEVIYTAPLRVLCGGFNVQYRFLKYKRLSLEAYGGYKFFFVPGPDFETIPPLKGKTEVWYMNMGLLCQLNFGAIAPFADIGVDRILTIGTEFNFHAIYRKQKKRYNLPTRAVDE